MAQVEFKAQNIFLDKHQGLSAAVETSHTDLTGQLGKNNKKCVQRQFLLSDLNEFSDSQINSYFQPRMHKINKNHKVIDQLMKASERTFDMYLQQGSMIISEKSRSIQELLSPETKIDRQRQKVQRIINRKKQLQSQLKKVSEQLKLSGDLKEPIKSNFDVQAELSSAQHKQFMQKMMKIRMASEQKRRLAASYAQKKNLQYLKRHQQQIIERQARQYQLKLKNHQQKLQQMERRRQKQRQDQKESIKRFKSVTEHKRIYEIMQQKYQQSVVLPQLEERNKILDERKKRLEGFSIEDIRAFEKEHTRMVQKRSTSRSRQESNWHYKPPPCSPRLSQLLQQQKIQQKLKDQQKKRALEQKKSRQESFMQFLKESIPIRIDPKKKEEMQKLMQKQPQRRRSESQKRSMGNSYMMQALTKIKQISKDKKQSQSTKEQKKGQTQGVISNVSTPSKKRSSLVDLQNRKLDQLIQSDNIESHQKLFQLNVQVEKIGERSKRKQQISKIKSAKHNQEQDLDELVASIKAKVGILQIYSK